MSCWIYIVHNRGYIYSWANFEHHYGNNNCSNTHVIQSWFILPCRGELDWEFTSVQLALFQWCFLCLPLIFVVLWRSPRIRSRCVCERGNGERRHRESMRCFVQEFCFAVLKLRPKYQQVLGERGRLFCFAYQSLVPKFYFVPVLWRVTVSFGQVVMHWGGWVSPTQWTSSVSNWSVSYGARSAKFYLHLVSKYLTGLVMLRYFRIFNFIVLVNLFARSTSRLRPCSPCFALDPHTMTCCAPSSSHVAHDGHEDLSTHINDHAAKWQVPCTHGICQKNTSTAIQTGSIWVQRPEFNRLENGKNSRTAGSNPFGWYYDGGRRSIHRFYYVSLKKVLQNDDDTIRVMFAQ